MTIRHIISALLLLLPLSAMAQTTADNADLDAKYARDMIHVGLPAPDMTLDSVAGISIANFRGRYVVLHFWATWCPDCRRDNPMMARLARNYNGDSVVFVHIAFDRDKAAWREYMNEHPSEGLHYTELKDMKEAQSAKLYGVKWIPSYYVINPKGKVLLATVDIKKLQRRLETLDRSQVVIPRDKRSRAPEYPGGMGAMIRYLAQNVHYPIRAANFGIEAMTIVSFDVETDGTPTNFQVASNEITTRRITLPFQKLSGDEQRRVTEEALHDFAEEAMRVAQHMPKWRPGIRYGQPVKVRYQLPVNFRMNYEQDNDAYTNGNR